MSNVGVYCYNCFKSAVSTVLISYGMNYQFLALGSVNFTFLSLESFCEEGNSQVYDFRQINNFWEILGVDKISYCIDNFSEEILMKYIKKNIPVIVETDCFDCSWNALYNIQHNRHFYLVKNVQLSENEFYYIAKDPFYKVDEIIQNYSELRKLASGYSVLIPSKKNKLDGLQILNEIKEDAKYYIDNSYASNIRNIANELKGKNILELINGANLDIIQIPIVNNMKILGDVRKAYFILINFLQSEFGKELTLVAEDLDTCSIMWEKARLMLMRKIISKKRLDELDLIIEIFHGIAAIEEKIFKNILSL